MIWVRKDRLFQPPPPNAMQSVSRVVILTEISNFSKCKLKDVKESFKTVTFGDDILSPKLKIKGMGPARYVWNCLKSVKFEIIPIPFLKSTQRITLKMISIHIV